MINSYPPPSEKKLPSVIDLFGGLDLWYIVFLPCLPYLCCRPALCPSWVPAAPPCPAAPSFPTPSLQLSLSPALLRGSSSQSFPLHMFSLPELILCAHKPAAASLSLCCFLVVMCAPVAVTRFSWNSYPVPACLLSINTIPWRSPHCIILHRGPVCCVPVVYTWHLDWIAGFYVPCLKYIHDGIKSSRSSVEQHPEMT